MSGSVSDTLNQPLPNANILAFPQQENATTAFAISSPEGLYRLNLEANIPYRVEVSYLGFARITDTLTLTRDSTAVFKMKPLSDQLGEVVIKQKLAVKVREDTITYRTDNFKTGEERKLRDVLKKLPGVVIDREGNATINGKEVTKLMVDGKDFFTGDEKLGVNNIPADAVDEVEAIDNYNEVSFLKGLSDSDKLVLNIKLKEGKKKFAFGDLEVGGGVKDRYSIHPNLFYYSPKTTINAIGDFNNIGEKSFTVSDYVNFEGGFARLSEDPSSYFNLYRDDFAQFLQQDDFIYNKNDFGAVSLSQKVSSTVSLDGYSIMSGGKLQTRTENELTYLTGQNLDEDRLTTDNNDLFFTLNKLHLRQEKTDEDLSFNVYLKTNSGDGSNNIISRSTADTTFVTTQTSPQSVNFTADLAYNKQFSYKHTTTATARYNYTRAENDRDWLFNRAVFSGVIPFQQEGDAYNLIQNTASTNQNFSLDIKHYWVLHRFHHIYPHVGINISHQDYSSRDEQLLEDGTVNNFALSGFNNNVTFKLNDNFVGFQYKAKAGKVIFKPGLFYHYYTWSLDQMQQREVGEGKATLLPEFLMEWEINGSEKLRINYNRESQFGDASQLANRLRLTSFNALFAGNSTLENQLSQRVSLYYSKFSLYRGIFLNARLSYRYQEKSIRNTTSLEGIDQINTLFYSDLPENSYGASGSFAKKIRDYRFTIESKINLSDYSRLVNDDLIDYTSLNYGYTLKVETSYDNWPNLEVGLRHDFSDFESDSFTSKFTRISPYGYLDYDFWKDFILKADYTFTYYENKTQHQLNRFQEAGASLYYNKESSAWGFEVKVKNLFDTRYRNSNSFTQFLISDQR
ncbi:MAG: carboxypeptidase-like regulatory domain-containing protein, partial [Leeuwenhoekiella sp.]